MSSTIGLVGGLGPEGTVHYYRKLVRHLGATPLAERPGIVIDHLWMEDFAALLRAEADGEMASLLAASLERLHRAGAQLAMLGAVTAHLYLEAVRQRSPLEIVDIVQATQRELQDAGHQRVGLLGTRLTLTKPFFKSALERVGIRVVVPDAEGISYLDALIFGPVARGEKTPGMRRGLADVLSKMTAEEEVDAVVVACTDLMDFLEPKMTLVDPIDCHIRLAARTLAAHPG